MDFKGQGIKATEASIAVIAAEIGVPYFRLRGVIEVEAPSGPFDRQDRPTMLFEPYWFYRKLPQEERADAVRQGVAKTSRPTRYPSDSYPILQQAMVIDEDAALLSCSWGRGQVMGFNHKAAGYADVRSMVEAACRSESEQLRAMASFIKSNGLVAALRRGDAAAFAKGYNGSGYARDGYDKKLLAAWAKWKERPEPAAARAVAADAPAPTMARSKEGNGAAVIGGLAVVKAANDVGQQVQTATDTATGLLTAFSNPSTLIVVAIVGAAALIWFWRRQRMQQGA